jgi:DNA (cytosine-5)-methyltransferase 1
MGRSNSWTNNVCIEVLDLNTAAGVAVTIEVDTGEAIICYVEYMYEKHDVRHMIHGRILQKGTNCPWQCCK